MTPLWIATAGWAIPRGVAERFPAQGSGLQRYTACFSAVEINSTFYRRHRASTYARWHASTPTGFRFAVKLPKAITHEARLVDANELVAAFRDEVMELKDKLGPLLVQLPPSLAFAAPVAERFFTNLRETWPGTIACEPRHKSWFDDEAEGLLRTCEVGRVAADPPPHPAASAPGGWEGLVYWRLHGSPRMYHTPYQANELAALALTLRTARSGQTWCVFDNTASGSATANALDLRALI